MFALEPAAGLAIAPGEASTGEDGCAQLTAARKSKNGRTSSVSRTMTSFQYYVLLTSAMHDEERRFA
jgi:hypothetical protein